MKLLIVFYVMLASLVCFLGTAHADDPNATINWRMILGILMFITSPLVAKFCGLL